MPTFQLGPTKDDIKRDEMLRRPKVEELARVALEAGWELGAAGCPKPNMDMTWDDEGHAHVRFY